MATKRIKVEPEKLEGVGKNLCTYSEEYKQLYTDLYHVVDDLDVEWDGIDNDAFTKKIKEFQDDFEHMYKELQEAGETLQKMGKKYRDTQEEIKRKAENLKGNY